MTFGQRTSLFFFASLALLLIKITGQISVDYWLYYPESGAAIADFTGTNYVQLSEPSELQSVGIAVHTLTNIGYFLSDSSLYEWDFTSQSEATVIIDNADDLWFSSWEGSIAVDSTRNIVYWLSSIGGSTSSSALWKHEIGSSTYSQVCEVPVMQVGQMKVDQETGIVYFNKIELGLLSVDPSQSSPTHNTVIENTDPSNYNFYALDVANIEGTTYLFFSYVPKSSASGADGKYYYTRVQYC